METFYGAIPQFYELYFTLADPEPLCQLPTFTATVCGGSIPYELVFPNLSLNYVAGNGGTFYIPLGPVD